MINTHFTAMAEPLVVFENVTRRFGAVTAVDRLNLTIDKGEFVAIMGSSGCGKTTTLRMLAGLETPDQGEVRLAGRRMNEVKAHERETPLVWQSLALFPFLNVVKNVEFGLKMRGLAPQDRRRRALDWLERLQIGELAERRIDQLSGGQRQRVGLARALVTEPEILLLDEPLSALDANLVVRMQSVLSKLQKELGITFLYVTHSQSEAFAMADRVVIMSEGRIEQIGSPREVYRSPANRFVAEFVGTNNILAGVVAEERGGAVRIDTGLGSFEIAADGRDLAAGDRVSFVVSADRIQLAPTAAGARNEIACSLSGEEFVGSVVTLFLEAPGGQEIKAQIQQRELDRLEVSIGGPVFASWQPDQAYILPKEDPA